MKTVNKIMVAVDFSEYSAKSVQLGASLARDTGADLLLVNVINEDHIDPLYRIEAQVPTFSVKAHIAEVRESRTQKFGELLAAAKLADLNAETVIDLGIPHKVLLKCIEEKKPDLLVMATKGRGNLIDTIVGSCAQKMFRRCPIPLLSIRGSAA